MRLLIFTCIVSGLAAGLAACRSVPFDPQRPYNPGERSAGVSAPKPPALSLGTVARETGIPVQKLETAVQEVQLDAPRWLAAVEGSKAWQPAEDELLTGGDLERAAGEVLKALSREELLLLAEKLSGMGMDDLRAWFKRHRGRLRWGQGGSIRVSQVLDVLRALRYESGLLDLQGEEPAFYQEALVEPVFPGLEEPRWLYQGTRDGLPQAQGWLFFQGAPGAGDGPRSDGASVFLDTGPSETVQAGFFTGDPLGVFRHPDLPLLDRHTGFVIRVTLRLAREEHLREDRAGLSLLVTCSDLAAVEAGFWMDQAWLQEDRAPLFDQSHGEGAAIDLSAWTELDLVIQGGHCALVVGPRVLLKSPLKNYTSSGQDVYKIPDFVFIGDNTRSASCAFQLGSVRILPLQMYLRQWSVAGFEVIKQGAVLGAASSGGPPAVSVTAPIPVPVPDHTDPQPDFSRGNQPAAHARDYP